jgi:chemotaxis protein CheD
MFNPITKTGGLLHAVLPEQSISNSDSATKFVNTGIPILLEKIKNNGSDPNRIVIYMAGGANMLVNSQLSKIFDIGTRNVAAAIQTIEKMRLRIQSSEVGGNTGRTVRLYISSGRMTVRIIGGTERDL